MKRIINVGNRNTLLRLKHSYSLDQQNNFWPFTISNFNQTDIQENLLLYKMYFCHISSSEDQEHQILGKPQH